MARPARDSDSDSDSDKPTNAMMEKLNVVQRQLETVQQLMCMLVDAMAVLQHKVDAMPPNDGGAEYRKTRDQFVGNQK